MSSYSDDALLYTRSNNPHFESLLLPHLRATFVTPNHHNMISATHALNARNSLNKQTNATTKQTTQLKLQDSQYPGSRAGKKTDIGCKREK